MKALLVLALLAGLAAPGVARASTCYTSCISDGQGGSMCTTQCN